MFAKKPAPPGKLLSTGEYYRDLHELSDRNSRITTSGDLEVIRSSAGMSFRDDSLPVFWVEIGGDHVEHKYSGYRVFVDEDYELSAEDTLFFTHDGFPLVEMTGNADVPAGALVKAYPADNATHYQFVWSGSASDTARQVELCRVAGDSETVDGIDIYPAYTQEIDPNGSGVGTLGWVDVEAVALAQRWNFPLTVGDGEGGPGPGGVYMAKRSRSTAAVMVFGAMYPLYMTDAFPQMDENCVIKN